MISFVHLHRSKLLPVLFAAVCCTAESRGQAPVADSPAVRSLWKKPAHFPAGADSLRFSTVRELPYTYTGQLLDGRIAGVSVMRASGEPGVAPMPVIRGLSMPLGQAADQYANRPLYVVNGIPLIRNDHPYALALKDHDFTDIGSGIDVAELIDMENVQELHVLRGPEAVAMYGTRAAGGAIVITTRNPELGRYHLGLNVYGGVAAKPQVKTLNGFYQRDFLMPFYRQYANTNQWANFPVYLADSTQNVYFGPANWDDMYYKNAIQHGVGLNITGGSQRANFRFGVGEHTENGVADATSLKKYNVFYDMNIIPVEGLNIHTYIQMFTARRDRNRSLTERLAEEEYITDQQSPLSPNKAYLGRYYGLLNDGTERNIANSIQGMLDVGIWLYKGLEFHSQFSIDYNDNDRDLFVPAALNDNNSFNSYFTGVSRRVRMNNYLTWDKAFRGGHQFSFQLGQSMEEDQMKYDYIRGWRGPSDFIKIIQVDPSDNEWVTHEKSLVYTFKDFMKQRTFSFYGNVGYTFDRLNVLLALRNDGTSLFGNGYWWAFSPVVSAGYDVKRAGEGSGAVRSLKLHANVGRTAVMPSADYFGYGPYFTVDAGFAGAMKVSTYNSMATLNMPFTRGYTGGGIRWPYNDHLDIGMQMGLFRNWNLELNLYTRTGRNLLAQVPVDAAYGFSSKTINGMDVNNKGIELQLQGKLPLSSSLTWTTSLALAYNTNKVLELPYNSGKDLSHTGGRTSIEYGIRHLETGRPMDQYWLLQNEGIYRTDDEVPTVNGKKMTYNGIALKAGDPRWKDVNGDGAITDADRVMEGHTIAPLRGGWNNTFQYRKWTMDLSFSFAAGNHLLNGDAANRFNFANREGASSLDGVKEITFWQLNNNLDKYPRYNPWSLVNPYQTNQDLWLEKASWLKLQAFTLRHELAGYGFVKKTGLRKLQVYATAMNLFTLTPYKGGDPSLMSFTGIHYGVSQPLPRTFTIGINADL